MVKKAIPLALFALISLACGLSTNALSTHTVQPPTLLVNTVMAVATQESPTTTPTQVVVPTSTPVPPTSTQPPTATQQPTDTPQPSETPPRLGPVTYVIQEGDTLFGVAQQFGIDLTALLSANPGIDTRAIQIGDEIIIPLPGADPMTLTPGSAAGREPVGFVVDPQDGTGLLFFSRGGSPIAALAAPGFAELDSRRAHVAGAWQGDLAEVPVVHFTAEGPSGRPGAEWLRIVAGSADPVWIGVSQFFAMAGAAGQPVLAYSTLSYEQSQVRSQLYAGDLQALPGASPLFDIADPDGFVVRPLAVDAETGSLKGIWYTMAAWGIGGDIVFEPRKGLKFLDMTTGQLDEILNRDMAAWDISSDRSWVAYSTISGPLSVQNLRTGEGFTYPLLPESNRGAGNACISPDGLYVAWMEGSGWTMAEAPDFHITTRIATTAGVHLADIPQSAFDNVAGAEQTSWVQPVGWLDGRTLLVQVRFQPWSNAALLRVGSDGGNPLYLASGTFVTFLYP